MPCSFPRNGAPRDHSPRAAPPTSWGCSALPARRASLHAKLASDGVHRLGKLDIPLRDTAGIMGRQGDLDGLVDIAPFRMMVVLFGDQGGAGHEAEGLVKILENEGFGD